MIQPILDNIYVYRDDLFPFLGGGNKARKMIALDNVVKKGLYDALVTTGGIQSNHCRATALYCQKFNLGCTLVIHGNESEFHEQSGNAKIMRECEADLIFCDASEISMVMDQAMEDYRKKGHKPYYLYGGGHTLEGGKAYSDEIERIVKSGFTPEQIYIASGTGSTQAGILAGVSKLGLDTKVIGISIGRQKERAEKVLREFYEQLCHSQNIPCTGEVTVDDRFLCGGYQQYNEGILNTVKNSLAKYNILLDTTYTGKAFYGMLEILKEKPSQGNVLFWNTGGMYNYFST